MTNSKVNKVILLAIGVILLVTLFGSVAGAQEAPTPVEAAAGSDVVKQELIEWMKDLRSAAQTGAAFAGKEIPLIIQEKIAYERVFLTVSAIFLLFLTIVSPFLLFKSLDDDNPVIGIPAGAACVIAPLVFFVEVFSPLIKVWFAPRLYIVEWLVSFTK